MPNRKLTDSDLDAISLLLERVNNAEIEEIEEEVDQIKKILTAAPARRDVGSIRLFAEGAKLQLTDSQQFNLHIAEADPAGAALATDEGTATWASDDAGAFVTLTPSADGFDCLVAAVTGANGTATITATVTVVQPSSGATDVFSGSDAVVVAVPQPDVGSITLTEGAAEPKP